MLGLTIGILAIFLGCIYLGASRRTEEIRGVIYDWEKADRSIYTFTERELGEEQIEEKCNEVCDFYSAQLREKNYQHLYDAVAEISSKARVVDTYERIVTDIRADYRYGEIRAYMDCVVDYKGYGGYIVKGEKENIEKRGKCTYTFDLEKTDDGYIITKIKIEWDE